MRVEPAGNYLHLYREDGEHIVASRFLGWRQEKGKPYVTVEDNLVNNILLNRLPTRHNLANVTEYLLRDYQLKDVQKMVQIKNVLNRNPMGLGKTVEAIITMKEMKARSILIVAPKIVCMQWEKQFIQWWPERSEDTIIFDSKKASNIKEGTIVIINYEKLLNESTLNKLRLFRWDVVCVDEAHRIKNRASRRTKSVKSIPTGCRIALTGTPILNRPDDLWSILNFLDWRYSGISYWNFVNYFCEIHEGFWGREITGLTQNLERVRVLNSLMDYISVYNPINVAQGKTREVITLEMTPAQRKLYKDMKNLVLDELPENATIANGAVLTTRVIQATSWPGLFIENEPGPKFEWIMNACIDNPTEKFVVFTRFEKTANALREYLASNVIQSVLLTGAVDTKQREVNKEQFIQNKDVQVLIGTIAAMGVGTDGLQYASHICIFIDRDWSPEIMEQCEDRLNRYGQEYPVISYILECAKSFDQHVGKVNLRKSEDIRKVL